MRNRNGERIALTVGLLLMLPVLAQAQEAVSATPQLDVMRDMLSMFQTNAAKWMTATGTVALRVFSVLALIELALKMRKVVLSGGDEGPVRIVGILLTSCMTWGFFLWAIQNPDFVLGNIIRGFEALGGQASGLGTLNPTQMIGKGIDMAGQISTGTSAWTMIGDPAIGLTALTTEVFILMGFGVLGLQMFAALLHYYLLLACAPILLAGGALSFTRDWAIKQFQGAVATGVKIFVIYVVAGVVSSMTPTFQATLTSAALGNAGPLLGMLMYGILILFLAFFAPSVASSIMGGTTSMNGNEMAGFGMAVGGAVAGGAAMAFGGVAGAAKLAGASGNALGRVGDVAGAAGGMLGSALSSGGSVKEALSTGANGSGSSGAGGSAMETAKRVGGDMPSGMSPSTPQSKALMSMPATNTDRMPSTGGASSAGSATAGQGSGSGQSDSPAQGASSGAASAQSSPDDSPSASPSGATPAGNATEASIGGNTPAGNQPATRPQSVAQRAAQAGQKASDAVGRKFQSAKSFIPEQKGDSTLHINLNE
ncbi:P-type conjugative transfer protein TrbL [Paraburkholderia fungorum]|uniref:P-type conjugative transfer protein TrbL n=1 Tax=Paraburkholderia fungorum TaxID=134537 RepID=UPI0038B74BFE